MVPRIGGQGSSFKGAAAYYLHDKEADTNKRVEFTHTRNLPTDDPEMAWRWMARTAMDSERLKREAGVDRRGKKSQKPVFTFSLSWHPEQAPDQEHMIGMMERVLDRLGLSDHQVMMVSHNDEPQPHIHAIVNLIRPDNGRTAQLKWSKERLSKWALEYEREHGIYCEQRVANDERRERARKLGRAQKNEYPRYREQAHALKDEISRRYHSADSGKAFRASLAEIGLKIARGRRLVVVGPDGKQYSLARQIEGARAKDVQARLQDIAIPALDDVRRRFELEKREQRRADRAETRHPNTQQQRRLSEIAAFSDHCTRQRLELEQFLNEHYGENETKMRRAINRRERQIKEATRLKRWYLDKFTHEQHALENDRLSLASIEQRKTEARGGLEERLEVQRAALVWQHGMRRQEPAPGRDREYQQDIDTSPAAAETESTAAAAPEDASASSPGNINDQEREAAERAAFMEDMNSDHEHDGPGFTRGGE